MRGARRAQPQKQSAPRPWSLDSRTTAPRCDAAGVARRQTVRSVDPALQFSAPITFETMYRASLLRRTTSLLRSDQPDELHGIESAEVSA